VIDPQSVLTLIQERRSFGLKDLKPDPVPREIVEQLLHAAQWAPNHGHTEPWRFMIYMGEGRRALGEHSRKRTASRRRRRSSSKPPRIPS
jgi:nitroreductase